MRITGLNHQGQGVGRSADQVVFVDGALPGETVDVIVRHRAKRHLLAEHRSTLLLSPDRRRPPASWPTAAADARCSISRMAPRLAGKKTWCSRRCDGSAASN
ncbi:TRAM domain-containing protein [Cyanobium sp. ATX-6F1]|uniref:TRAM domain-containing protein n=1 Tax=Cyanobium sp. ATX-6F1 TaxID=3137388 RepID=UPI0039BDCD6D